jgi:cysteine-rich repeat protein
MALNRPTLLVLCATLASGCFKDIVPDSDFDSTGATDPVGGTPPVPVESTGDTETSTTGSSGDVDPTESGDEPRCGDGSRDPGEACDDGNRTSGDGCSASCQLETHACRAGVKIVGEDLEQGIGVCKDSADSTCEENFASLCAPGWHLCSGTEHVRLNDDTLIDLGDVAAIGVIRCRTQGGSGHYTSHNFNVDGPDSCEVGSSRLDCPTNLGCNEGMHAALCCAPVATCGNGVVDDPREECDDGNSDNLDACSNACANRFGSGPHC